MDLTLLDHLRKWACIAFILFVFSSVTIFLLNHFYTFREYHKAESYVNSAISIAQKNGGFYEIKPDAKVDVKQKQRLSFSDWTEYSLRTIYSCKTDLTIKISANGNETVAKYDGKTGKLTTPFDKTSPLLSKRLQRGDEFTITVIPTYKIWNILPPKLKTIEGKPIVKSSNSHAYVKIRD